MSTRTGKLESRWTAVGGLRMHARVSVGTPSTRGGVPVVLVHGLVVSSLYMVPTAERLAPFYRVYAPDLPGFGKSDRPADALDVAGLADALGAWMDAAGLGRAVLVGNSLGCQVIAEMAARHPRRAAAVVLAGPSVDRAGLTLFEQFKRLIIDATREPLSITYVWLRSLWEAGLKGAWRTANYALENSLEENLVRLSMPALVVCGTRDPIAPPAWAEHVARLLPRGRLAVIEGGTHALNYSTPVELSRLIREFIEREAPSA